MTSPARADSPWTARLAELEKSGRVFGLHALTVTRGGKTIFEHYGTGEDEKRDGTLATVTFGPAVPHDLRSVSKSVVSWVYGIALAQGKVPTPETKLSAAFPQYADLLQQPGRDKLRSYVLNMTVDMVGTSSRFPTALRATAKRDGSRARSHPRAGAADPRTAGREMDV